MDNQQEEYTISRTESFQLYYWTGSKWSRNEEDAKLFLSGDKARQEMRDAGIEHTVSINKKS